MENDRYFEWFGILILIGFTVLVAFQSSLMPFTRDGYVSTDTSVWLQIAKEMLDGKMVYVNLFDHKGPVLFMLFSAFFRICGKSGIWILQSTLLILTIVFCFRCSMKVIANKVVGAYATILANFGLLTFFSEDFSIEEISLPFCYVSLIIFFCYFIDKEKRVENYKIVILGCCMGIVFFLRPNMIALWLVLVFAIFCENIYLKQYKEIFRYVICFLIGFLGIVLLTALWLVQNGALEAWWKNGFLFNFTYSEGASFADRMKVAIRFIKEPLYLLSLFLNIVFLIMGKKNKLMYGCNLAYMIINLFLMTISGADYSHYQIALLPGEILPLSHGLEMMWDGLKKMDKKHSCRMPFIVITLFGILFLGKAGARGIIKVADNFIISEEEQKVMDMMQHIEQDTQEESEITVLGNCAYIYLGSKRNSATDFVYTYPVCIDSDELGNEFVNQLKVEKPQVIVEDKYTFEGTSKYENETREILDLNYRLVLEEERFKVYKRKN